MNKKCNSFSIYAKKGKTYKNDKNEVLCEWK